MFSASRRSSKRSINIWPGFVDALATLLLVIIFVLMVFMVAQFTLSNALSGKDKALSNLNKEISELAELLSLEKSANTRLRSSVTQLTTELQSSISSRDSLANQLASLSEDKENLEGELLSVSKQLKDLVSAQALLQENNDQLATEKQQLQDDKKNIEDQLSALELAAANLSRESAQVNAELEDAYKVIEADKEKVETQLAEIALLKELRDNLTAKLATAETSITGQKALTEEAQTEVVLLNQQIAALRQQLSDISATLEITEAINAAQETQILDLGKRLNVALATKVQQLAKYRSEFFGKLREVLGNRQDIRIVGDRFVFQSEVLFSSGSATLEAGGQEQLGQLAKTLKELSANIPDDIDWILRVDGHTDVQPISTAEFPSNWELSTARSISVVKFLITQGIPASRLAATGFGQFQPLDSSRDEIAFRRNRRIELKLTQR
ncbi:peptidoglycan -binding protein [uncultured Kiloniella sp.]|uniref:peptidoglycan -binding protein n=1 Tax=uncultured Kiloniella sp. TaxID=1133091 RepID=UPI0026365C04|nr:peptidoglycan -binding protein [uncultured Kiloniella sp.]